SPGAVASAAGCGLTGCRLLNVSARAAGNIANRAIAVTATIVVRFRVSAMALLLARGSVFCCSSDRLAAGRRRRQAPPPALHRLRRRRRQPAKMISIRAIGGTVGFPLHRLRVEERQDVGGAVASRYLAGERHLRCLLLDLGGAARHESENQDG